MNFMYVFGKMVELFLIVIVGYVASKCGVLGKDARKMLSSLVLNVTLPAMILNSVLGQESLPNAATIGGLILVAFASYVILFAMAYLVTWLLRVKPDDRGIYRFMMSFGNVGFIGYPVTQAIFGDSAVFYTSVFNMPFNVFVYSAGVMFLQQSSAQQGDGSQPKKKITIKTFLTPCMITSVIAIILALVQIKTPTVINETIEIVAAITTPAALMIIGSSLADLPLKEMFSNVRIYLFSLCRLLVLPLVTYVIFGLFVQDELLLGVAVLMASMPVATNGTMLCLECGTDERLMAQGTFITTLLSIVTIPLIATLIY